MAQLGVLFGRLGLCAAAMLPGAAGAQTVAEQPAPPLPANAPRPAWTAPASGPAHVPQLLLRSDIHGVPGKELRIFRTVYPPGAINTKHFHTSHVVFYILEGSGVWQEEEQQPITLKAGDVLLTKPGTVHAHWNPSKTETLVFSEVVIVDPGMRSTVKTP
jgi:quercetin dioxygenase-like cupin family protein